MMNIILQYRCDDSPRNRLIAIIICQKLYCLSENKRRDFLPGIMEFIGTLLGDRIAKIVSRTCDFVSGILDKTDIEDLKNYIKVLMGCLIQLVQSNDKGVISEATCSISYIALKIKDDFSFYYRETVDVLKAVMQRFGADLNTFEVNGRIIECLSVIAMVLKGQYCMECANIILEEVRRVMSVPNISFEHSIFGFVETSFTRVAEILQEDIVDFYSQYPHCLLQKECNLPKKEQRK